MGKDKLGYLQHKMENNTLEEVFEQFDLDPTEVFMILHREGFFDLEYYMDDEWFEEEEQDVE